MSECEDNSTKIEGSKSVTLDKGLRFGGLKATKNVNAFVISTTFFLVLREIYC